MKWPAHIWPVKRLPHCISNAWLLLSECTFLLYNQGAENANILFKYWHLSLSIAGKTTAQGAEGISSQVHQV